MLEGAKHLCFVRLVWWGAKPPTSPSYGRRHCTAGGGATTGAARNGANLQVAQRDMLQSSTA
jgi:hypothetical protein